MRTTSPYGSWPSPVTVEVLTAGSVALEGGTVDGDSVYWTEGYADQRGRTTLWRRGLDGVRVELTPEHDVRATVHEYGGGAWDAADGVAVYSDVATNRVFVLEGGRPPRPISPGGGLRYAGLRVYPAQRLALAVREDHTLSDIECVNTVVGLRLDADNADGGQLIARGADFYAAPDLAPDGRIAWVEWDHPNMPWDSTRLCVASLRDIATVTRVEARPGVSVVHPRWRPSGELVYLADPSGFWNFHAWDGATSRALHDHPSDFCGPAWTLDPAPYALLGAGAIGCSWLVDGIAHVGVLAAGELRDFGLDAVSAVMGTTSPACVALLGHVDRPVELALLDWRTGKTETLRAASDLALPDGFAAVAEQITVPGPDGDVYAWYYPPTSPDAVAPAGELPPVHVLSHGGPTGFAAPAFRLESLYWTSRGYGLLDVNYGGSAGYGRAYRERLSGRWGIVDVRDCVAAASALVDRRLADPERLVIRGGSAGGYTTLRALTTTDRFTAGISLYGISDLEVLARECHKFESRYLDGLVAPYPAGRAVYVERSPLHHLEGLTCPMLIVQGLEDKVVPPNQAVLMADAVRAKGLPVALLMLEGEGHGFRRADSIRTWLEAAQSFLGRLWGFTPADPIEPLRAGKSRAGPMLAGAEEGSAGDSRPERG